PAGLTLRSRLLHNFLPDSSVLELSRDGLAKSGLAVGVVTARAVDPPRRLGDAAPFSGIVVALDGEAPHDRTPPDDMNRNPLSAGRPEYDFYTMEVVQRIGYDSFTPDNGVLIAKNKYGRPNDGTPGGGRGAGTRNPAASPAPAPGGRAGGG